VCEAFVFVLLIKLHFIKHHFHRVCPDSHIIQCSHLDDDIKSIQTKFANNANLAGITRMLVDIRIQSCLDKLEKQFFKIRMQFKKGKVIHLHRNNKLH